MLCGHMKFRLLIPPLLDGLVAAVIGLIRLCSLFSPAVHLLL